MFSIKQVNFFSFSHNILEKKYKTPNFTFPLIQFQEGLRSENNFADKLTYCLNALPHYNFLVI